MQVFARWRDGRLAADKGADGVFVSNEDGETVFCASGAWECALGTNGLRSEGQEQGQEQGLLGHDLRL